MSDGIVLATASPNIREYIIVDYAID